MTHLRRMPGLIALLLVLLAGCESMPIAYLRQRGNVALDRNDQVAAHRLYSSAVAQDPTDWKAQWRLGEILVTRGEPLEAQLALEKAWALRPVGPETKYIIDALAEALFQQDRAEALHGLLNKATDQYGTVDDFLRQGHYLAKLKENDGAKVAYLKAIEFASPGDVQPYLKLATFCEQIGDRPACVVALRQAHYIKPLDPRIANMLRENGIVPGPAAAMPPSTSP